MSGFFNFINKITTQNHPNRQTNTANPIRRFQSELVHGILHQSSINPKEKIIRLWNELCQCTLIDTPQSLSKIDKILMIFFEDIEKTISKYAPITDNPVIEALIEHQIPKQLVTFSLANIPKGLYVEVINFFAFFTKVPFSEFLSQPFIINPLNTLLDNSVSLNHGIYFRLIQQILQFISFDADKISLFLISPESSPLLHQFSQLIVNESYFLELAPSLIQILNASNRNPDLLSFLMTYCPLLSALIGICKEMIEKQNLNDQTAEFIQYLCLSILGSPMQFQQAFSALFDEEINKPLIRKSDPVQSLSISIYILCSFSSLPSVIKPIYDFIFSNFDSFINSQSEKLIFLTIRCLTLMLETSTQIIFLPIEVIVPESVKIYQNFIQLIPAEWMLLGPDISDYLSSATSKVLMSNPRMLSKPRNPDEELVFDLNVVFPSLLNFLSLDYIDKHSLRTNLALTEFFTSVAAIDDQSASYLMLSEEYNDGFVLSLQNLCTLFQRRIGKKPDALDEIKNAYQMLKINEKDDLNELFMGFDENSVHDEWKIAQKSLFYNVVILLEFLKELVSIAQSKNLLHQQSSITSIFV